MNVIELSLFVSRMQSVCDEMGAALQHTAFSPNIRDRLDFSCAVFDEDGNLCAQAAHIPVHLGSMAYAMQSIVSEIEWQPGDCVILNDPFLGGTHLPDVTFISPVFVDNDLHGFVANRAHHANIGATTPGSMPVARTLEEEGLVIQPVHLCRKNRIVEDVWSRIMNALKRSSVAEADFNAQLSANRTGVLRLLDLIRTMRSPQYRQALSGLNDYAERMAASGLGDIPRGSYRFSDLMDDDGQDQNDIPICVTIDISDRFVTVDFNGTAAQVSGNINCPLSVTAAAVYYCFFCLMPEDTPPCAGAFRSIRIRAAKGSLVNASAPAAVAAGNVETSTRIVDVILGALAQAIPERIPAASQGTMNNVAMGSASWDYYETLAGGMGAGKHGGGLNVVQTHMTNTSNTPIEILEMHYPIRINRYQLRPDSGGVGTHRGGLGLVREYHFLADTSVSLITERRRHSPWGLAGGGPAASGINLLNGKALPGKITFRVNAGDVLAVATPGGGGWGVCC
ncbi:MAG: hydantoinase B/oxoprolinase family protein [Gammaproteobacteria bacterium]|nr:hydantoinase B/oxoprolinase family protein [Gammaproteobacteria bacterium]